MLEYTAFVAGWKAHGHAQLGYVKEALIAVIQANKLVTGEGPVISKESSQTENFHMIETPMSGWPKHMSSRWHLFRHHCS